jgi:hypothetical protein
VVGFWDCWKSGSGFTPDIVSRGLDWKALLLGSVERLNLLMKLLKAVVKLGSDIWEGGLGDLENVFSIFWRGWD